MTGRARSYRQSLPFALCVLGFVACNTYSDSMLVGTLSPNLPASAGGGSSNAGQGGAVASAGFGAFLGGSTGAGTGGSVDEADDAGAGGLLEGEAGDSAGGQGGTALGGASASAGSGGASASAGTGGSAGAGGSAGLGGGAGAPSGSLDLIDDFEDLDGVVTLSHKRNGPWYTFSDGTVGGVLSKFAVALLTGSNVREGSTAAAHLTASGFTDWGAGIGVDLVNIAGSKVAYDVSAYSGVRFYARVASGASVALKFLVPTTYSDPSGAICSDALPYTVPSKRCNDHLYRTKTLSTTWTQYDVLFADLVQQGFGLPQAKLDPTSVYSLQWTLPAGAMPIDLWLDDVSFIVK